MINAAQPGGRPGRTPAEDLTPELREFLDRVIVPALVREYLAEQSAASDTPAAPAEGRGAEPAS
jgi:hypothetical protein